jgi:membrane protein implicated in regulation of membrane protease activity
VTLSNGCTVSGRQECVNTGEFLALTFSGIIVNLAGIALTAWLGHRSLRRHVDQQTNRQTEQIVTITNQQTGVIEDLTRNQTRTLLGRKWRFRRSSRHDAGTA